MHCGLLGIKGWLGIAGVALLGCLLTWRLGRVERSRTSLPPDPEPSLHLEPPALSESHYLNVVESAARFVGSGTCAECHPDQHDSYLQTAHSRALSNVEPSTEPADGVFHHPASGRSYRVYRDGDRQRHRETVTLPGGEELVLADHAMRYGIGSGRHSRSYLVENDGFLFESPVTWYAARQSWAMSPGYDVPHHAGFERAVDIGCLFCHAGRVERPSDGSERVRIREQSIGCESCHGPGSLHVARRRSGAPLAETDWTIVNPDRLSRALNESICAQCHLRGAATVAIRGRDVTDFRPGLPLADFRVDYGLERPDESMKVVGHVEQMWHSRCYQESESLTCTTCHDPHAKPDPEERLNFFREKCLSCHSEQGCALTAAERLDRDPLDNCIACHMPQVPTDIPHFAFTHHRIGKHAADASEHPAGEREPGILVPLVDDSHLGPVDRDRNLGLAYLELWDRETDDQAAVTYLRRAHELLAEVRDRGLRDPVVDVSLGLIHLGEDPLRTISFAASALESHAIAHDATTRTKALALLGESFLQIGDVNQAHAAFEELVRQRRLARDWMLLGVCRRRLGDRTGAMEALERSIEIKRQQPDVHQLLAELYAEGGASDRAARSAALARQYSALEEAAGNATR